MTLHTRSAHDAEPTPEFNERCLGLVMGWRNGDIQPQDAVLRLKSLSIEASATGHTANQGRAEHLSGYLQHYLGNLTVSNMHYEKARSLFERVNNLRRVATMDLNMGENYRYKGEFKRARRLYRSAYEMAVELNDVKVQTIAITNEGLMLVNMQEYRHAQRALEEGYALSEQWETDDNTLDALRTEIHYGLAEIAVAENDLVNAWQHATLSLQNASVSNNLHSVGLAYRILGDALTTLGTVPEGAQFTNPDDYYRAALDSFREIDAQAEIGRTVFSHARSVAKRGRRRPAAQLFRDAMVVFTRLGMTADAAKAAEAQLGVI